ncbi:MAG: hypothetical protein M3303_05930, partial [Gemmatimonadota bacterium]|nr:hypothetical protein [Gemmatimonadota bacterium]
MACEYRRLRRLYGVAGRLAAKRTEDSVYARNRLAAARMQFRFPDHFEVGEGCALGGPRGP